MENETINILESIRFMLLLILIGIGILTAVTIFKNK